MQIGWAIRDMTPTRPAMLMGQMHRRVATAAMDPLQVTALAIEGDAPSACAILVACDLAMISDDLQNAVRDRLRQRLPDVPSDTIVMNATHTHTSLVIADGFYPRPDGDVMTPAECLAWVADRAAEVAAEAWTRRAPHTVQSAFGHAVVGHNRRAVYTSEAAQMYGKTDRADFAWIEGYEDHSLDMLFTWDAGGRLTGVALAIPCPSQVTEGLDQMSADFWHEIRAELRARLGNALHLLPLCGASGDQSPHFLFYAREEAEMRRRRGVSERREIALRVADAVTRALACTPPPAAEVAIPFAHAVRRLNLTPRGVSRAERDWAQAEYDRFTSKSPVDSWWPQRLRAVVEQADGLRTAEPVPVELHALRLGALAVVTNPFELYLDYALRIKARSPAAQTAVVQLTAGTGWYLPSARAVRGGGYGAMPAVAKVGPEGGDELVEVSLAMIRDVYR